MLTQSVTPVIYAAEMVVKHGDEVIEGGTSSWVRNLDNTSDLNVDDFLSLKDKWCCES